METECVTVYRKDTLNNSDTSEETFGLTFRACGEKFGFSCLPYTAEELENATHQEELPLPRRTVVCICGSVRGVGVLTVGAVMWKIRIASVHKRILSMSL